MQVLSDDVAIEFPGGAGVHCAAEQLHAVLYLPHAHSLHHHGVCCLGPRPQIQQKQRWHHLQVSPLLYLAFTLSCCCHRLMLLLSCSCFLLPCLCATVTLHSTI